MAEKKKKLVKLTTPVGIAVWPKLNKPDTKFAKVGEKGRYGLTLRLRHGDAAHDPFIASIKAQYDEAVATLTAANPPKPGKQPKIAEPPYAEVFDEAGVPTGEIDFRFGMQAWVKPKDKEGWDQEPALFNAMGQDLGKCAKAPRIGSGSTVVVNFSPNPFYTDGFGAGLSLRLNAVQILELVEFGKGSAKQFGFEAQPTGTFAGVAGGDDEADADTDGAPTSGTRDF